MRGAHLRRGVVGITATFGFLLFLPRGTGATVNGPCTATLSDVSVTQGRDTPGSSVHVDYTEPLTYAGEATNGDEVTEVVVAFEVLGIDVRMVRTATSGPTWSSTTNISDYAWAGIGLYRVTGTASTAAGPLCDGVAYVCVEGKSPIATAAGGVAIALGLIALGNLIRGFARRKSRGRVRMATRYGLAGFLGGAAAAVLLQQSCVVPLDVPTAAGFAGGGLLGFALIGAAIGGVRAPAAPPPAPVPPAAPPSREDRDQETRTVYRFAPPAGACNACRSHAAHRTYRSREAIESDRPHPGCNCEIVARPLQESLHASQFAGRDVFDDREG